MRPKVKRVSFSAGPTSGVSEKFIALNYQENRIVRFEITLSGHGNQKHSSPHFKWDLSNILIYDHL
jgi:hypothetical protein